MSSPSRFTIVALILVVAGGAFVWWRRHVVAPPPPAPPIVQPVAPATPAPTPAPARAEPAIRHPIGPAASPPREALPALDDSDAYLKNALGDLLGRKNVLSFLVLDGIARRFVATVDNLATDNAAAELWPVNRTPGHIATEARDGGKVIGAKNADRHAAFVRFFEGIDMQRAVALYVALYPLFQRAYEDLGSPGKYFNDRVVQVIDNLLATPDIAAPIKVKRITVDGSTKPADTGGLYVFEDPALEASSSGQKILLRVGRENARQLKAKLADIRQRIVQGPGPRR